jgi:hypothetical protein
MYVCILNSVIIIDGMILFVIDIPDYAICNQYKTNSKCILNQLYR